MESPLFRCVAACAEFPNDNPLLHREHVREAPVVEVVAVVAEPLAEAEPQPEVIAEAEPEAGTDPAPPVLDADDEADDIEIVEDLVIEDAVEEAPSLPPPPPPDDPFEALTAVLEEVARGAGASDAAMHTLRVLLGRERIAADAPAEHSSMRTAAAAWCAILRGESEDFTACGATTLDEWSSMLVAAALGDPARADSLRRELRRRGVAAFGLVVEAA